MRKPNALLYWELSLLEDESCESTLQIFFEFKKPYILVERGDIYEKIGFTNFQESCNL